MESFAVREMQRSPCVHYGSQILSTLSLTRFLFSESGHFLKWVWKALRWPPPSGGVREWCTRSGIYSKEKGSSKFTLTTGRWIGPLLKALLMFHREPQV